MVDLDTTKALKFISILTLQFSRDTSNPTPIAKIHLPTFKKELDHLVEIGVLEKLA